MEHCFLKVVEHSSEIVPLQAKTHLFCETTISKGPMIKCELKKKPTTCTYVSLIDYNPSHLLTAFVPCFY